MPDEQTQGLWEISRQIRDYGQNPRHIQRLLTIQFDWHQLFCRRESLLDRKQELRRLLSGSEGRIQYVDYVDGRGVPLFEQGCQHDLEGIVAKQKHAPYVTDREASTWFKIRNPHYSQWAGREKLFERERSQEP